LKHDIGGEAKSRRDVLRRQTFSLKLGEGVELIGGVDGRPDDVLGERNFDQGRGAIRFADETRHRMIASDLLPFQKQLERRQTPPARNDFIAIGVGRIGLLQSNHDQVFKNAIGLDTRAHRVGFESGIPTVCGSAESYQVIRLAAYAMPKACSSDLRERVIEAVEQGASRREAAECFDVSPSSAVKWLQSWLREGRRAPKPRGGSSSPLEDYADEILALVAEQPD
jgi:hypothetical protein